VRFWKQNIFFHFEKRCSLLQRRQRTGVVVNAAAVGSALRYNGVVFLHKDKIIFDSFLKVNKSLLKSIKKVFFIIKKRTKMFLFWFFRRALEAAETGQLRFEPKVNEKLWSQWLSRDRYFFLYWNPSSSFKGRPRSRVAAGPLEWLGPCQFSSPTYTNLVIIHSYLADLELTNATLAVS
jgi:hypothetical protein